MTKAELEARRLELANTYCCKIKTDAEPNNTLNKVYEIGRVSYLVGWDSCAALLQGEMDAKDEYIEKHLSGACEKELDAEKERYELALASSIRYGNKVFDLESQLQSANAKLAVMRDAIEYYAEAWNWKRAGEDHEGELHAMVLGGKRAREALAQIAALDASEGKGKV